MLSTEGQFTFTAEQPQLHCATFFIGEPEELITIDYDFVDINCQRGDFLKVRSWQLLLLVPAPALVCEVLAVCGRARECVCVCVHTEQPFTKHPSLGLLLLLPQVLWWHSHHHHPCKAKSIAGRESVFKLQHGLFQTFPGAPPLSACSWQTDQKAWSVPAKALSPGRRVFLLSL